MKAKFETDELIRVDPEALTFAPWNPQRRIDATDKAFKKLVTSIRKHGQFVPALINEHGLVIDGNRRVAACQLLGHPAWCVVRGKVNPHTIYEVVNSVRLSITGSQVAEIYQKEKRALPRNKQTEIERLAKAFGGIGKLNEYLDSPQEWEKYGTANHIRLFCRWVKKDLATPSDTWALIRWMRDQGMRGANLTCHGLRGWSYELRPFQEEMERPFIEWLWSEIIVKNKPLPFQISFNGSDGMTALIAFWAGKHGKGKIHKKMVHAALSQFKRWSEEFTWHRSGEYLKILHERGIHDS